ncbi:hypothetical protein G9A89_009710 [Geosiphon pyriformis]|nr:hypothetical protein G9A89_009710 [Geosiphon pyriformis]
MGKFTSKNRPLETDNTDTTEHSKDTQKKALFQYFQKDLEIPAETTITESDFCNYINAKINCLLGRTTDTERLGEQIYQTLLGSNNPTTAQDNRIVFNPPPETQLKTPQTPGNPHPWGQYSWTKSLGEYGSLFENLIPTASQTEKNMSTWKQPPAQNPAESASSLTEKTAILQSIGTSNKEKQSALAPREHSNMQTPISLNITSNISLINQIMAYWNITKLEKFSGEKDNAYSWITDAKKAITTNGWDNNHTIQTLPFFLTGTANSWYQSFAEKPTSFTEFKLAFLQYFSVTLTCDFESAKQEANHIQKLTNHHNEKKITTTADTPSNRTVSNSNNLGDSISTTKKDNRPNLRKPIPATKILYAQQVSYTQPLPWNYYQLSPITQTILYYQTPPYSQPRPQAIDYNQFQQQLSANQHPAQSRPAPTGYPNQASYLGFMEDQGFDKSIPVE